MARLYEFQGKKLLKENKIAVPIGGVAKSPEEAKKTAEEINKPCILKGQLFVTGRADLGLIKFANNPDEVYKITSELLGKKIGNQTVEFVLVEEKLDIEREFYAGVIIDDAKKCPVLIFSSIGGTGIEKIAKEYPDKVIRKDISILEGIREHQVRNLLRKVGINGKLQLSLGSVIVSLYNIARKYDARAVEINPLILDKNEKIIVCDCRITIDDYAVYKHPELGIQIAREFDRPPTPLDVIAYKVEEGDYRGTFYFVQLEQGYKKGEGYIGFHGAGGGGSMMSMDAVLKKGYKIANFCDTSGNPPASKVYRAAKIILSQGPIDGYFGSGSGVASQEQFHSARGLVKAFREFQIDMPVVIRLGGNQEERAIEIMNEGTKDLPSYVECYGKDTSVHYCAERFDELVKSGRKKNVSSLPEKEKSKEPYSFKTVTGGEVIFDHSKCADCKTKICIESCIPKILKLDNEKPVLNISKEEAMKGKCTECLACEIECEFRGNKGAIIILPIPGLENYSNKKM